MYKYIKYLNYMCTFLTIMSIRYAAMKSGHNNVKVVKHSLWKERGFVSESTKNFKKP